MARSVSVLLAALVLVASVAAGCSSEPHEDENDSMIFQGLYASTEDAESAGLREIFFDGDRYWLVPGECPDGAEECAESGTFTVDRSEQVIRLESPGRSRVLTYAGARTGASSDALARPASVRPLDLLEEKGHLTGSGSPRLVTSVRLLDRAFERVQDIAECDEAYGMGSSGEGSKFEKVFQELTKFRVDPRGLNGCFEPARGPALCTTFDSWWKQWEGSCSSACNMPGGFADTAKKAARKVGSCAVPTHLRRQYPRPAEEDAMQMVTASVRSRGGEVINGQCRCVIELQYEMK